MKGLMRVFSSGLSIWRGWRRAGLLRVNVGDCAGSHSVGRVEKRLIDTVKVCLRKMFGCQASKENGTG